MPSRLVGNDKVSAEIRPALRRTKALQQGLELRPGLRWWPALAALSKDEQELVKQDLAEVRRQMAAWRVWELSLPRVTTDGWRFA